MKTTEELTNELRKKMLFSLYAVSAFCFVAGLYIGKGDKDV